MKKKFTYGLLLLASISFSCNVFTSCKDTEDDLRTEMNRNDQQLQDLLDQLKQAQEDCKQSCNTQFTSILLELAKKADAETLTQLQTKFGELQTKFDQLLDRIGSEGKTWTEEQIRAIVLEYCNYDYIKQLGFITEDEADNKYLTAESLKNINLAITNITEQLNQVFGEGGLKDKVTQLQSDYDSLKQLYDALNGTVTGNYNDLKGKYDQLSGNYDAIKTKLDGISNDYTQLITDLTNGKYGLTKQEVMDMISEAYATQIQQIQSDITNIQNKMKTYDQNFINIQSQFTTVNGDITNIKGDIFKINGQFVNINDLISQLTTRVENLEKLKETITDYGKRISTLEGQVVDLTGRIDGQDLKIKNLDEALTKAAKDAIDALTLAKSNSTRISTLQTLYDDLAEDVANNGANIGDMTGLTNLADEIRALKEKDDDLQRQLNAQSQKDEELADAIQAVDDALNTHLKQYAIDLDALQQRVKANEDAIKEIKTELEKIAQLENRINSLITSMIVQGVYNPLFGTFSLPIGVQSNMLVNYYGFSDKQTYSFPSTQQIATVDNKPQLSDAEYAVLQASGLVPASIENGAVLIDNNDANLGKLFLTINPNNVDFTDGDLTLVNSQDAACTVKLKNLKRSDEVLKFGYSARSAQNGFYEADAYLEPNLSSVSEVSVHIDDNLKSAMKDILSDGRSGLRANAFNLLKALYDQFNGILPAYGLKAAWTVNGQNYATYSTYNIAATTFRPLSYSFMHGQSLGNKRLPMIDPISNAIIDINAGDYQFDFGDITINIDTEDINLNFQFAEVKLDYEGGFDVTVKGEVDGKEITLTGKVDQKDLDAFIEQLEDQFTKQANEKWTQDVERAFRKALEQLNEQINIAINKAIEDMEAQINENIEKMINDIKDQINNKVGSYIDRFNSFINRYNNIAKRINNFLDDPNYYMQPAIFYRGSAARDFLLSTNPANPTVLVNDGGNGFMIYATSYNAEIVAPSYKKVVAITDVIDNATGNSVADAQAQCVAINNSADFLAEVCPGYQKRFVIPTANMKSGHTYEILYTSVDYHGVTATCRYYVTMR